jgi:hypothetical protein
MFPLEGCLAQVEQLACIKSIGDISMVLNLSGGEL